MGNSKSASFSWRTVYLIFQHIPVFYLHYLLSWYFLFCQLSSFLSRVRMSQNQNVFRLNWFPGWWSHYLGSANLFSLIMNIWSVISSKTSDRPDLAHSWKHDFFLFGIAAGLIFWYAHKTFNWSSMYFVNISYLQYYVFNFWCDPFFWHNTTTFVVCMINSDYIRMHSIAIRNTNLEKPFNIPISSMTIGKTYVVTSSPTLGKFGSRSIVLLY